jgi:hypothetical protein
VEERPKGLGLSNSCCRTLLSSSPNSVFCGKRLDDYREAADQNCRSRHSIRLHIFRRYISTEVGRQRAVGQVVGTVLSIAATAGAAKIASGGATTLPAPEVLARTQPTAPADRSPASSTGGRRAFPESPVRSANEFKNAKSYRSDRAVCG